MQRREVGELPLLNLSLLIKDKKRSRIPFLIKEDFSDQIYHFYQRLTDNITLKTRSVKYIINLHRVIHNTS